MCEIVKDQTWPMGKGLSCYDYNYIATSKYGWFPMHNCKETCDEECLNEGLDEEMCEEVATADMKKACENLGFMKLGDDDEAIDEIFAACAEMQTDWCDTTVHTDAVRPTPYEGSECTFCDQIIY